MDCFSCERGGKKKFICIAYITRHVVIKRNKGKAHAFFVGEVNGFWEHGRLLQRHTHTHTHTCMHAYKIMLSTWMDILPKALRSTHKMLKQLG